jgi:hypothetical protein
MTPELREQFRQQILGALQAASPTTMSQPGLEHHLAARGFDSKSYPGIEREIERELGYLSDKGLLRQKEKTISPAARRWQITAAGTEYLEMEGLA